MQVRLTNMPPIRNGDLNVMEVLQWDLLTKISMSNRVILELDDTSHSLQVWPWCTVISLDLRAEI